MKETLLQRCQREAREKFKEECVFNPTFASPLPTSKRPDLIEDCIAEIVANTLKQAAEEIAKIPELYIYKHEEGGSAKSKPYIKKRRGSKTITRRG